VTPGGTRGRLVVDESPDLDDDTLVVELHPIKSMAGATAVSNNFDARLWSFFTGSRLYSHLSW
jgi:hypothetical protein